MAKVGVVKVLPVANGAPPVALLYHETVPAAVAVSVACEPGQIGGTPVSVGPEGGVFIVTTTGVRALGQPIDDIL